MTNEYNSYCVADPMNGLMYFPNKKEAMGYAQSVIEEYRGIAVDNHVWDEEVKNIVVFSVVATVSESVEFSGNTAEEDYGLVEIH